MNVLDINTVVWVVRESPLHVKSLSGPYLITNFAIQKGILWYNLDPHDPIVDTILTFSDLFTNKISPKAKADEVFATFEEALQRMNEMDFGDTSHLSIKTAGKRS